MTMAGLVEKSLERPDGAHVSYRARPGRDPWVLLHGLGCDASMWDGVVSALPRDVGLLVPELRGHGNSSLGWRVPSVELWAEDVERLIWQEELHSPAVAGLSMGGYTALALAEAEPTLVRAWAFVSTSAAPDDDAGRLRRAAGLEVLRSSGWAVYADGLMPSLIASERDDFARNRERLSAMFGRARESGLTSALYALAARPDRRPILARIDVPCAVIVGNRDTLTPPERSEEIASGLADVRLTVIRGSAHMSAMEEPEQVARALAGL